MRGAPVLASVSIHRADGTRGLLCRAGWLTPYIAELVAADALRAGRGAKLEVLVPAAAPDAAVSVLRSQLGHLAERGVRVRIARDARIGPPASAAGRPTLFP
jgi:hypothetical protein